MKILALALLLLAPIAALAAPTPAPAPTPLASPTPLPPGTQFTLTVGAETFVCEKATAGAYALGLPPRVAFFCFSK